jgi:putative DNA primase/helicase
MDCNHLPVVKGTDDAIWERLIVIPFRRAVAKRNQNKKLSSELVATEAEGILAWMVTGMNAWTKDGLRLPVSMQRERTEWRQESDELKQWIEECCIGNSTAKTKSTELYSSYKGWRATSGLFDESTQTFARRMKEHGFKKKEVGHDKTVYWLGVGKKER